VRTVHNGYLEESQTYEEQAFAETPFADPQMHEQEEPFDESYSGETLIGNWEVTTPFLPGESHEGRESEALAPEVPQFSEMFAELKDSLFREALEQLADEALEAHSDKFAGEFGDRGMRDQAAERVLNQHFAPLAAQAEAMLNQFFEQLEGYEAESLTDMEIEKIAGEVLPTTIAVTPASEQFLGGLLRKAGKLVSGAVNLAKKGVSSAVKLAGKGLAAVGKLALGPLLEPLKKLAKYLLSHVVKFALNQIPPTLRPLGQQLADRLLKAFGETYESEAQELEQTESEAIPAAADAARLEAEFDLHAAQLLFTPDEAEIDHMVSGYGETESYSAPLSAVDDTRFQLVKELSQLQPGQNAQPVMEQFLPALWPVAKTAITILGRPKLVGFLGNLLAKLIKPLLGADAAGKLSPAIADAGLHVFGLESNAQEPRAVLAEALAATVEETINSLAELPPHVLENETLLTDSVHEAFENAASSYFPNSVIKPELRESIEHHGMWHRMPGRGRRKRYAKYSHTLPVEISPRMAGAIKTFGSATLQDHLRDHYGVQDGRAFKGSVTLYQALPGSRGSTIAEAEGFPVSELHPLTPQAAALLGENAGLGRRHTPGSYLATPQKLHVNQRLYRIHPASGHHHHHPHHHRHHHHTRRVHSELTINLLRGEIRLWVYLSESLCQQVSAELASGKNPVTAFKRLKPLLLRTSETLKKAIEHRHFPPEIQVIAETPNLDGRVEHWLRDAGHLLGAKIGEWAQVQLAQYLRNNADEFKRVCASHHDGVTLQINMTRIPGIEELRLLSQRKNPAPAALDGWPKGTPAFHVIARPGFAMNRLRS
jgi:hypothetical protein